MKLDIEHLEVGAVTLEAGEMLWVDVVVDHERQSIGQVVVGTILFQDGSVGMSVTFPPAKTLYRDQRGGFVMLGYDAPVRMEFELAPTPERPSGKLVLERVT